MTSPPVPYASILFCPLCGLEVHRCLPDDPVQDDAYWAQCEEQVRAHLVEKHRWRLRLWERTRWQWLLGGLFTLNLGT